MALAKLKILVEDNKKRLQFDRLHPIEALFNPNQITIQKTASWQDLPAAQRDVPEKQFTHGEAATLTMDLLFDTYEARTNVRDYTNRLFKLTVVNGDLHRPPLCQLKWGNFAISDFYWVLQALTQRFTLFLENGTPVRATLSCTFREWHSKSEEALIQNKKSADVAKTRTVQLGDTLSSIASEEYQDPTLWRPIAEANQIDNPRRLTPGQILAIPALHPAPAPRR